MGATGSDSGVTVLQRMAGKITRAGVSAAFAAALAGCADPAVDAVVAWVDAIDDGEGIRKLQVYDRGDRYALDIQPTVAGSGTERLRLDVDSRGDGIAISGDSITSYVSLVTTRQPTLTRDAVNGQRLSEWFSLTRNGDAMVRGLESDASGVRLLMPTTSARAGEVTVLEPPESSVQHRMIEASDAPVFFWVNQQGGGTSEPFTWGPLAAYLYPSDRGGGLPVVDEVVRLGLGEVFGLPPLLGAMDQRVNDSWCPGRACVSPDGRSMVVLSQDATPCTFAWWRWEDADPSEPNAIVSPQLVVIEDACRRLAQPWSLFAQLGHHTVALDDNERIYVVDLHTREVKAGPKLWDGAGVIRMADRGRVALLVSADSRVTRVDASGVRLLSTEAHPCVGALFDVVVSPSGYWVARSCNGGDGTFIPTDTGKILRLSPLGLEAFPGIPMRPLAIDDEGNLLLFSFDDDGDPRGLFVLGADGQLTRVDPLEPQPALITAGDGDAIFFGVEFLR
jgi:hypothetical protein